MRVRKTLFALAVLAVAAAALATRLPRLAERPMHCDEGNQAVKAALLRESGTYEYDPVDHHGPTLYYCTLPAFWIAGARDRAETDERMFRSVTVLFGAGVIVLLLLVSDGLGKGAALIAALLTALSPAMSYFARYYIQETLLVFFTLAAIASVWRYSRSGSPGWAVAAGASFGLMHATKETWVLAAAAMAMALPLAIAWGRWVAGAGSGVAGAKRSNAPGILSILKPHLRPLHLLAAAAMACLVATALYSSFGAHWQGPLDSLGAYDTYLRRGTEGGLHTHSWHFYIELLVAFRPARGFFWTEGLIVGLAGVGFFASLLCREKAGLCRFLAFYTVLLTAFYSLIPYKTPWCMLSFLHGMILLAGVGAWAILRRLPGLPLKTLALGLLAAGAVHLGWECWWLNFRLPADQRNPYVYAHTSTDALNLAARLERLAELSDEGHAMVIHVVTPENYWPLPWYLRKFKAGHVGCWHDPAVWAEETAPYPPPSVILLTADVAQSVEAQLRAGYNRQMIFGLRPEVFLSAYVREDLWEKFLAASGSPTR